MLLGAREKEAGLGSIRGGQIGLGEQGGQPFDRLLSAVMTQGQLRVGQLELDSALVLGGLTIEQMTGGAPELRCEQGRDARARLAPAGLEERDVAGRQAVAREFRLGQPGSTPQRAKALREGRVTVPSQGG